MSIFLFFILIILFILLLCTVVSVFQFLSDLKKNSFMLQELKNTIKRIEQSSCVEVEKESVKADE